VVGEKQQQQQQQQQQRAMSRMRFPEKRGEKRSNWIAKAISFSTDWTPQISMNSLL
jgi:hypothetical protein